MIKTSVIRALALGLSLSSAAAQDPETTPSGQEEKPTLESLQQQIDELKKLQEKQPVVGGNKATMKLFGRIHLDFWGFPGSSPGINAIATGDPALSPRKNIEFRRARLGVSGKILKDMQYKIEIDFGNIEGFSFKDVYLGWDNIPVVHTLLLGNQKRPYGLDHLNSSRYNVFLERPFVIEANNQDARRLGLAAYGLSDDQSWNWRYGLYEMTDWSKTGVIRSGTLQPEFAARVANTVWYDEESEGRNYAHWAVSGSVGWPDGDPDARDVNEARYRTRPEARTAARWINTGRIAGAKNMYLVGVEGVVNLGALQLVGEYQSTWVDRRGNPNVHFDGGYVYAAYFLTGEHMPWSRKSGTLGRIKPDPDGWGAWQVAARLSYADYTDQDIFGGVGKSLTLGLNYFWNQHAGVQFNYIHGEIDDRNVVVDGTTYTGGDYDIVGIRFRVDF